MTVQELYRFFEDKFPAALSADWDNDGLCCLPEPAREVRHVLVALDPTAAAVEKAVTGGYDLLLTHHPLLFRGVKALVPTHTVPAKLLGLARAGVAAISFHTRLDAASGGVNDILAKRLALSDVKPFAPEGEVPCGRIGRLSAPMEAADFARRVKEVLGAPAVLLAGEGVVSKIAVCGGEGADFSEEALAKIKTIAEKGCGNLPVIVAKTQYSLSDNAELLGRPEGFYVTVRDVVLKGGAGFIVAIAGKIMLMPGLGAHPAAEKIDLTSDGQILGLS
jgi:dinuclear metal center YbgI/SA1388 family protein